MLPIIGTVHNSVKLAMLDNQWQQKKESNKIFAKEMTAEERLRDHYQQQIREMQEKDPLNDISAKLKAGTDLTFEEIEYLRKNNPEMYREYMQIKAEKKSYERELKNCKTKEEVDRLKVTKMGNFLAEAKSITNNPNIPKGQKLALIGKILMKANAVQDAHVHFVESGQYSKLPSEEEISRAARQAAERSQEEAKERAADSDEIDVKEADSEEVIPKEDEGEGIDQTETGSQAKEAAEEVIDQEASDLKTVDYQDVRAELVDYIQRNRTSGYGLTYLAEDLEMNLQAERGHHL